MILNKYSLIPFTIEISVEKFSLVDDYADKTSSV